MEKLTTARWWCFSLVNLGKTLTFIVHRNQESFLCVISCLHDEAGSSSWHNERAHDENSSRARASFVNVCRAHTLHITRRALFLRSSCQLVKPALSSKRGIRHTQ